MPTINSSTKHILWVEHDRDFIEIVLKKIGFLERYWSFAVNITVAWHMDEARELLSKREFDLLILELMVPKNVKSAARQRDLDMERRILLLQLTRTDDEAESLCLRSKIDELDHEVEQTFDLEGGCEILEELAHARGCKPGEKLRIPVIIFTSRDGKKIRRRCKETVDPEYLIRFFKPQPIQVFFEALRLMLEKFDSSKKGPR